MWDWLVAYSRVVVRTWGAIILTVIQVAAVVGKDELVVQRLLLLNAGG